MHTASRGTPGSTSILMEGHKMAQHSAIFCCTGMAFTLRMQCTLGPSWQLCFAIQSSQRLLGVVLPRGLPDIFSKGAEEQCSEMLP